MTLSIDQMFNHQFQLLKKQWGKTALRIHSALSVANSQHDSERMYLRHLILAYNWATNPNRYMDDREHKACMKLGKLMMKRIESIPGEKQWGQTEDGELFVKRQ